MSVMWDWINCHLLGRHQHAVACDHGSIHLRCLRCGYRSSGWHVDESEARFQAAPVRVRGPLLRVVARRQA
jgi:hypothetical protein